MSPLRRMLHLMRPHAGWMALAVMLSALATLAHAALLATSGWFITAMALAGLAGTLMNYFLPAALIRGFAIVRILGRYGERLVGHEATLRFVASLRPWLFARLERSTPAASDALRDGDVLTRLRGDIDRLEQGFLRLVSPALAAPLVLLPVVAVIAVHDTTMALTVALLALAAGIGLPALLHRRDASTAAGLVERTAGLNARLVEDVEGLAELAIYDPQRLHRQAVLAASEATIEDERRLARDAALSTAAVQAAASGAAAILVAIGLPLVHSGQLAPADLPMLTLLALAAFDAMAPLPAVFTAYSAVQASARRIFDLADLAPPLFDPPAAPLLPARTSLSLSNVGFRYRDADAAALYQVSFDLLPGSRVAIVGASGSGKSTLADLLVKLRAPGAGEMALADVPWANLPGDAVRERVARLAQHDHLFSTSVRENLLLARPTATIEMMREACRTAQILTFIEAQPDGFETQVGAHGARLSGGEAHRLMLARTLLAGRPILVLDEPTEGLDVATEHSLLEALLQHQGDTALLLLTHRPASLDRMHEILLLDRGRILRRGPPAAMAEALRTMTPLG